MQHTVDPTAFVDEWIRRNLSNKSKEQIGELFIYAIDTLWRRCFTTLGEITLSAIFDRVFFNARRSYSWIGSFTVQSDELQLDKMELHAVNVSELEAGIQNVLEQLIKVIGTLTGGALTPQLYEVLSLPIFNEALDPQTSPQVTKDKSEGEF